MILIAHRGNLFGPQPEKENKPEYISAALEKGFDVEIDVWRCDSTWALGHDEPQYETELTFISQKGLWIHCKNFDALQTLIDTASDLNFFYHTNEDYVLTSQNYIWAYPNKLGENRTICVLPEYHNTITEKFDGICSNYVGNY